MVANYMLEYGKTLASVLLKPSQVLNQPIIVNVDTSNVCNLSCKMCYRHQSYFKQSEKRFLSTETLEKLYSQIRPKMLLLGGISAEPLMNKNIHELVRLAHDNGSRTFMTTNGQLIDENTAYRLLKNGIYLIKVSMDAATPETYAKIRGSNFERLLKNIRSIAAVKRDLGIRRDVLRLDFVIQKDNLDDVVPFIHLTKELGASFAGFVPVNFLQFTQATSEDFRHGYDLVKIEKVLKEALRLSQRLGVKTSLPDLLKGVGRLGDPARYEPRENDYYFPWMKYTRGREFVCMNPWLEMAVYITGEVSLCCTAFSHKPEKGLILGNIHEDRLMDIWNGRNMQRLRELFRTQKNYKAFDICKTCLQKLNIWHEIKMNNLLKM